MAYRISHTVNIDEFYHQYIDSLIFRNYGVNMKKFFWRVVIFIAIFIIACGGPAWGRENEVLTPRVEAANLDLSGINKFIQTLDNDIQKLLPGLDPKSWGVTGPVWDFQKVGKSIIQYFLRELVFNLRLLGELLIVALALAVLQNIKHAFESDTVSQLAFGLCFIIIMALVLNSLKVTFTIAGGALQEMTNFMYAILPLLFTLIVAGGGLTTTAIVHPLLISSVGIVAGLVNNLVFPMIMFAGVLGMASFIVDGFQVNKLANLLKTIALGILGTAMALFIGLITIRGFAASVADSAALRTAKYLSGTFLPVVGGTISDTMEMAVGCSMVVKAGVGVFGLGLIILITIFPLLKILAVAMVFQLTGAAIQPLGNNRLADALQTAGHTFFNIFGALAIVGLMFFIAVAILIGVANFGAR
jgi:stage III sporulation protein AE